MCFSQPVSKLPVVSHPWASYAFSAQWVLTDPSSSTCPAFPWIHCYICICNTLYQKHIHGFLPTTKQTMPCDLFECVSCSLPFVPSVPLLGELVNNLPLALSHRIAFWSKISVLHSPSLLAFPPLLQAEEAFLLLWHEVFHTFSSLTLPILPLWEEWRVAWAQVWVNCGQWHKMLSIFLCCFCDQP